MIPLKYDRKYLLSWAKKLMGTEKTDREYVWQRLGQECSGIVSAINTETDLAVDLILRKGHSLVKEGILNVRRKMAAIMLRLKKHKGILIVTLTLCHLFIVKDIQPIF